MEMSAKGTVLIVDDEPYILRILKMKLEHAGYGVITAINGMDAWEKIQDVNPVAVVTDINMPRMDGRDLCRMMNHHQQKHPFLTIVMTSGIDRTNRTWAEEMENTVFVEKPFSPRKILKMIDQYLLEGQAV